MDAAKPVGEAGYIKAAGRALEPHAPAAPPPLPVRPPDKLVDEGHADLDAYDFLIGRAIDAATLRRSTVIAVGWAVQPHEVMIALGWVSVEDYTSMLAERLGVPHVFAPLRFARPPIRVDATLEHPSQIGKRVRQLQAQGLSVELSSRQRPELTASPGDKRARVRRAIGTLRRLLPHMSAGAGAPLSQVVFCTMLAGLLIGATITDFALTLHVLMWAGVLLFCFVVILRLATLVTSICHMRPLLKQPARAIPMADLPIYSVLIPLYKEAEIVPDLVDALIRLDYPAAKLDVILILEDVDRPTRLAAENAGLPGFVRIVSVPQAAPRTKPKALNYAMEYVRGDYVVVYDAEDIPEPRQLRDALEIFASCPDIACLQGRLNIYNADQNWLTAQFALEYTMLFDGLLPALERLGIPLPLGGTSNHFRRDTIERLRGWDPFNVTEDADLGLRIYRRGGTVGMLASTTWEEAPATLSGWIPQRTRWFKGWLQTYSVHMRRPAHLLHELGAWQFIGFQCLVGGYLLSAFCHPLLYIMIAVELARDIPFAPTESANWDLLLALGTWNLVIGYVSVIGLAVLAAVRRRRYLLALTAPMMPLYWLLSSFAAYRALWQLFTAPYHWEKTAHTARGQGFEPPG